MRILTVTYNDADNLTIAPVLFELEKRGHTIMIFAPYDDADSLRMFRGLKAQIRPFAEFRPQVSQQFDLAFCTVMMMECIKLLDVYCFVYSQYFEEYYMTDGADFLFTHRRGCLPRCDFRCATMEVGDTKNDLGEAGPVRPVTDEKRILFIDSGHIPFGDKGKEQIADLLLEACQQFPEYEIWIKPRWLRQTRTHYSHQNGCHLYDVLEKRCAYHIPPNLVMLNEHRDLQELIDNSRCVMTLYTGATLNVLARKRGLLVLSGWENDDKWDMRNAVVIAGKERMYAESGCLVDIREAIKYLPNGLQPTEAFQEQMACRQQNASQRMADVMEFIFETYLRHGQYPATREYEYETFRQSMSADPALTLEDLKYERFRDVIQKRIASLTYDIVAPVDFSHYYQKLDAVYRQYPLTEEGFVQISKDFAGLQNEILIEQGDLLQDDEIDQSFWLQALFNAGREEELLRIDPAQLMNEEAYRYYLGMIYARRGMPQQALENFSLYLASVNKRTYIKFIQGSDMEYANACRYVLETYDGTNFPAVRVAQVYVGLHQNGRENLIAPELRQRAGKLLAVNAGEIALDETDRTLGLMWQLLSWQREEADAVQNALQGENQRYEAEILLYKAEARQYEVEIQQNEAAIQTYEAEKRQYEEEIQRLSEGLRGKFRRGLQCLRENGLIYTSRMAFEKLKRFLSQ